MKIELTYTHENKEVVLEMVKLAIELGHCEIKLTPEGAINDDAILPALFPIAPGVRSPDGNLIPNSEKE